MEIRRVNTLNKCSSFEYLRVQTTKNHGNKSEAQTQISTTSTSFWISNTAFRDSKSNVRNIKSKFTKQSIQVKLETLIARWARKFLSKIYGWRYQAFQTLMQDLNVMGVTKDQRTSWFCHVIWHLQKSKPKRLLEELRWIICDENALRSVTRKSGRKTRSTPYAISALGAILLLWFQQALISFPNKDTSIIVSNQIAITRKNLFQQHRVELLSFQGYTPL